MKLVKRLRSKIKKALFNFRCRSIYATRPVCCDVESGLIVLSQLYHPDVTMYLLAAKSFARYVSVHRFVVVDDGLTVQDRELLEYHLGDVEFVLTGSARREGLPTGGCWERISTIAAMNAEHYVVQLDSDILTIELPSEVIDAVNGGRSFTLGTPSGTEIVSAASATAVAVKDSAHVQACAERVIDRVTMYPAPKYVRGCAGFAGFARGRLTVTELERFSAEMEQLIGTAKWAEWGSEQVTSNFMIANTPNALVLPVVRYPFMSPNLDIEDAALIHFFGTYRFHQGRYAKLARRVISELA